MIGQKVELIIVGTACLLSPLIKPSTLVPKSQRQKPTCEREKNTSVTHDRTNAALYIYRWFAVNLKESHNHHLWIDENREQDKTKSYTANSKWIKIMHWYNIGYCQSGGTSWHFHNALKFPSRSYMEDKQLSRLLCVKMLSL